MPDVRLISARFLSRKTSIISFKESIFTPYVENYALTVIPIGDSVNIALNEKTEKRSLK